MKIRKLYFILIAALIFISFPIRAFNDGSRYAEKSVLSSGKWIQLKVSEDAVYKLTYDDIRGMGISDPSKVKIYGYGGWILDEDFSKPYIDDLPEVSVYMNKGSDGVFGSGDYLLFYGRGTVKWTYSASSDIYTHENNPYSTFGSYFLTESESAPKEMSQIPSSSGGELSLTTFDDYALHERDSLSIAFTGRELFGESFVNKSGSQNFTFSIPGITSDPGKVYLSFAAAPIEATPVYLSIDGNQILNRTISAMPKSDQYRKAYLMDGWDQWLGSKLERTTVSVSYNSSGQSVALLNFINLNMQRSLQFYNRGYTFFRNKESINKSVRYNIDNASSSCLVWDITNNYDTRMMQTSLSGTQLSFSTQSDNSLHEYVMVDLSKSFPTPEVAGEIKNQNLHSLDQTEMVIIVPEAYMNQAETLAEKHRTSSKLNVTVVDHNLIFNEFSSGVPDATAYRRFMKMFYDRAISDAEKPRYLLLFGDGLFDNRHLTNEAARLDSKYYLLTYQVKESVNETNSYGTDDYFGFLDDSEGISIISDKLDIGIGRFPVNSVTQATNAVNKVIAYINNKQYGHWKNKIIFTADNTDSRSPGSFCVHATQADELARNMERDHPEYMVSKYYMDAYKPVDANGQTTFPDAKKAFLSNLNDGCFLVNYTGHGSTRAWSAEDMLYITDIRQMKYEHLPLWITATCDFGWFDGIITSGGEEAFLNKNSGAIALFTTTRVVLSSNNFDINEELITNLFKKVDGEHLRLGDILRESKVALKADGNKLNYVLLGDPALKLNYPTLNVELESVNGKPIAEGEELSFKALEKVTLTGVITDENGNKINDFNGNLRATVFDSKQTIESIDKNTSGNKFSFTAYPNMIYAGNSDVENGSFTVSFNVPLDISYTRDNGKMSFYASNSEAGLDASGCFQDYILAGTSENPNPDEEGPEIIEMYLNTANFKDGDDVNETPFFYANVFDEDGINMTGSGLGHDIMISIDDNPVWTYNLTNYYTPVDAMEGIVGFSIPELTAGNHVLTFRVWDILNNPSTDSLRFNVVKGFKPEIYELTTSINPAKINTYFILNHDMPETQLDVEIRVYDLMGRAIWSHTENGSSGFLKEYPIEWDLTNNSGGRVPPGIYVYRAAISTSTSKEATKAKKIIVLGQ